MLTFLALLAELGLPRPTALMYHLLGISREIVDFDISPFLRIALDLEILPGDNRCLDIQAIEILLNISDVVHSFLASLVQIEVH